MAVAVRVNGEVTSVLFVGLLMVTLATAGTARATSMEEAKESALKMFIKSLHGFRN
jgi:hypothetical protein